MSYREGLSARLVEVRKEVAGATMREFTRKLNSAGHDVSRGAVSNRENGSTEVVPASYLAAICRRWSVHPVWMLTGLGRRAWEHGRELERDRLAAAEWMERLAEDLREGD